MQTVSNAWIEENKSSVIGRLYVRITIGTDTPLIFDTSDDTTYGIDFVSFNLHEENDMLCFSVPSYRLDITVLNRNDQWNPDAKTGLYERLKKREKVVLELGYFLNGAIEWHLQGTFYLWEWNISSNDIYVTLTARDILVFLENPLPFGQQVVSGTGKIVGLNYSVHGGHTVDANGNQTSLYQLAEDVANYYNAPHDCEAIVIDDGGIGDPRDYDLPHENGEIIESGLTALGILQLIANLTNLQLTISRDGWIVFEKKEEVVEDYTIPLSLSFKEGEYTTLTPTDLVIVNRTAGSYTPDASNLPDNPQIQQIQNVLIGENSTTAYNNTLAEYVYNYLQDNRRLSGEYRIDPRVDIFDIVYIETKYNLVVGRILSLDISFDGLIKATYNAQLFEDKTLGIRLYVNEETKELIEVLPYGREDYEFRLDKENIADGNESVLVVYNDYGALPNLQIRDGELILTTP